jgi:hypothetical protein
VRVIWVVAVAACGRIGFEGGGDAGTHDAARDGVRDVAADALPADLIAYFPLDGTLEDVVGGPPGTCATGECPIAEVAGHLAAGMRFDGTDDCVTVVDVGQLGAPQITISIWANETGPLQARECQVSKRVDNVGMPYDSWQLETTGGPGQESFTSYHGGGGNDQVQSGSTAIQPDVWQHIVATYDGLNENLYVDGVQVDGAGNSSPLTYDSHPVQIGCDDNNGFSEHYQGVLDELRIYSRALSPAEIQALP